MENIQLQNILHALVKNKFSRVFSKGQFIHFKLNTFYVYNTETPPQSGHFIVLFIQPNLVQIFDSLGKNDYEGFENHFPCHTKFVYLNNKKIQGDFSAVCSLYCIYVIFKKVQGTSFKQILHNFHNNSPDVNDSLIYSWYIKNPFFSKYKQISFLDSKSIKNIIKKICKNSFYQ